MKRLKILFIVLISFSALLFLALWGGYYYIQTHYQPDEIDAMMPFVTIDETKRTKSFYFHNGTVHRYQLNKDEKYELIQDSQEVFTEPKKIAILYIATGRYINFWEKFYKATEKNFLPRHQKTYFLFTDSDDLEVPKNVVKIHQDQLQWPHITLRRYEFFMRISEKLKEFDYIYFMNANLIVMRPVNEEIFPSKEQGFMVTLHPGYWFGDKEKIPYDRSKRSATSVEKGDGEFYVMGAFNGFRGDTYLQIFSDLEDMMNEDLNNGVIPRWHDESLLNKYVVEYMKQNKRPLILLPDYLIPERGHGGVNELRGQTKILILEKGARGGHKWFRAVIKK